MPAAKIYKTRIDARKNRPPRYFTPATACTGLGTRMALFARTADGPGCIDAGLIDRRSRAVRVTTMMNDEMTFESRIF